jgi:hypothetical protein
MTKPKTILTELSRHALQQRLVSANRRLRLLEEEQARREKIKTYGTVTPDGLADYEYQVEAEFSLIVKAQNEADAARIVDESGWLYWYFTSPGDEVIVVDWAINAEIDRDAMMTHDDMPEHTGSLDGPMAGEA